MSREPAQPLHHLLLQTLAFTDSVFFDILHQQPEYGLLKDQVALGYMMHRAAQPLQA